MLDISISLESSYAGLSCFQLYSMDIGSADERKEQNRKKQVGKEGFIKESNSRLSYSTLERFKCALLVLDLTFFRLCIRPCWFDWIRSTKEVWRYGQQMHGLEYCKPYLFRLVIFVCFTFPFFLNPVHKAVLTLLNLINLRCLKMWSMLVIWVNLLIQRSLKV